MKNILHTLKRQGLLLAIITALIGFVPKMGLGQPWSYDFGTSTGSYNTASGSSTSFFTGTPSGGGTYRIRCATTGNQGSGFILANPGTSLGTGSELQTNASVTASTNKFGVYDWTSPSTVAYMKCKLRTTSSGSGTLSLCLGINTLANDNNGYTSQYNNSIASLTITYATGAISSVVRRISGSNTTITGSGFTIDADQIVEIYANNGSGSVSYTKSGTNSLATKTWDLWVDGMRVVTNAATAGTLAAGTNLSGFGFFAESSTSNAAWIYIDDLEYSNALPSGNSAPTVTTQAASSILTTTATGNGNITATGGVDPIARGFCWDLATNPDPDITDSKVEETGSFSTGAFTGSITVLSAGTQYKARAYATNSVGTGYGNVITFSTLKNEPTEHVTSFLAGTPTTNAIPLTWTDAGGAVLPDGYLIKGSTVDYSSIIAPTDNVAESNSILIQNVAFGAETYTFTGLAPSTTYYFKIWPYTNSGTNINYKTDGTIPDAIATTTSSIVVSEFRSKLNGDWDALTTWEMFISSSWVNATRLPTLFDNVTIRDGHIVEVTTSPNPCKDLTIETNGKLWTNSTLISNPRYISISGNLVCDGTIGNGNGNNDAISFNIAGTMQTISGNGSMTISRLRKLKASSGTTELSINKDIELRFSGTAIYNDAGVANSFQVIVQAGKTINCTSGGYTLKTNDKLIIYGNVTLNNTLTNNAGVNGLIIKSDVNGTGSLLHNTNDVLATIERYVSGSSVLNEMRYHMVSIPLKPESDNYSIIFLDSYLFRFDEPTDKWVGLGTPIDRLLYENRGYMTYAPVSGTTYYFKGPMNNGYFLDSTYKTVVPGYDTLGWNLVPNPYPCAIDWKAATGWNKTNIESTLYTWNASLANYAVYNSGPVGTNGCTQYIPEGQAFFVHASGDPPLAHILSMDNNVRVHNSQAFLKQSEEVVSDLIRIKAATPLSSDEIIVNFRIDASDDFDPAMDAYKINGSADSPQLSSIITSGKKLSINSLPFSSGETIIPLNFTLNKTSSVTFSATGQENFTMMPPIYLEDLLLNKVIDLQQQAEYTFAYQPGQTNRFQLRFMDITSTGKDIKNDGAVFYSNGKINIDVPGMEGKQVVINTYDVAGRCIKTTNTTINGIVQVDAPLATGVYIIRVISGNNTFVRKVVVR